MDTQPQLLEGEAPSLSLKEFKAKKKKSHTHSPSYFAQKDVMMVAELRLGIGTFYKCVVNVKPILDESDDMNVTAAFLSCKCPPDADQSKSTVGNSLVVQCFGFRAFTVKGRGLVPGQGTKIPQAARCGQKNKSKRAGLNEFK